MRRLSQAPRRESKDERDTSAEWRRLGHIELKIEKCNHNGWPDRWYAARGLGIRPFWCEWKQEGKDPNELQAKKHDDLREQGEIVIVAHSRREFWQQVRAMQSEQRK